MVDEHFRSYERSIAYEAALDLIEGECLPIAAHTGPIGFYDTSIGAEGSAFDEGSLAVMAEAALYLEWRGLLERHPHHPNWVQIRNESEPLPGKAAA